MLLKEFKFFLQHWVWNQKISHEYAFVSYTFFLTLTQPLFIMTISVVAFVAWDKGEKLKEWEKWVEENKKNLGWQKSSNHLREMKNQHKIRPLTMWKFNLKSTKLNLLKHGFLFQITTFFISSIIPPFFYRPNVIKRRWCY